MRAISLLLLLVACGSPEDTDPAAPVGGAEQRACDGLDWDTTGAPFVLTYCTACHSSTTDDRGGAPAGLDFETYEGVAASLARIDVRAVQVRDMPPTGGPPDVELEPFAAWLACGAPR